MNARIVPAERSLVDEITKLLTGSGRDYSANLVIFPGRRPSHFLRRALAGRVGGSCIPPEILSMNGFIDKVHREIMTGRHLESIDAVALLYDLHGSSPLPLGGKEFMTIDSFFPIGMRIFSDIEELLIEGIHPGRVRGIDHFVHETIPHPTIEKLQALSFFYERFYKKVARMGCTTRALRYSDVARDMDPAVLDQYDTVLVAGFFAPTKSEADLFQKIDSCGKAVFLFQEGNGLADQLSRFGVSIDEKSVPVSPTRFFSSPDTHGQMFALSQLLEEADSVDERTAVVLPSSESLFPLIRHGLTMAGEGEYNITMGYPLQRTPLYGFFMNLMELVESMEDDRCYVPAYLRFVLHPYTKNIYFENDPEITRIMFHAIEDRLAREGSKRFLSLGDIEEIDVMRRVTGTGRSGGERPDEGTLRKHLRSVHANTIEQFLSFENVEAFADKCAELIEFMYRNSTARLHPLFTPFAEAFMTVLDRLRTSLLKDMRFEERASYFSLFRKYVTTGRVPFDGTPLKGLQVLGLLETRGLSFERVYVLDTNEEAVPEAGKDNSLIPFGARRVLGLPTYQDRDRLAAYYFDTLVKGAKDVNLFFVENDTRVRSRFVEKLLWESEKKDRTAYAGSLIETVQYRVDLKNKVPDPAPKSNAVSAFLNGFVFTPTAIDRYLRCPLRFYYTDVLRAGRKKGVSDGIERADIGQVVHGILGDFFADLKGRVLEDADLDPGKIKGAVRKRFRNCFGEGQSGAIFLFRKQVERHLEDLVLHYYRPLARKKAVTILETEKELDMELKGFRVKGRLDMVERRGTSTLIIDFKTGASSGGLGIDARSLLPDDRSTWYTSIGSLQLPLYMELYRENTGCSQEDLFASYLMLGKTMINEGIEVPLFPDGDQAVLLPVVLDVIERLLREICDPAVPFSPTAERKKECPACNFRYICGTQWIERTSIR